MNLTEKQIIFFFFLNQSIIFAKCETRFSAAKSTVFISYSSNYTVYGSACTVRGRAHIAAAAQLLRALKALLVEQ